MTSSIRSEAQTLKRKKYTADKITVSRNKKKLRHLLKIKNNKIKFFQKACNGQTDKII